MLFRSIRPNPPLTATFQSGNHGVSSNFHSCPLLKVCSEEKAGACRAGGYYGDRQGLPLLSGRRGEEEDEEERPLSVCNSQALPNTVLHQIGFFHPLPPSLLSHPLSLPLSLTLSPSISPSSPTPRSLPPSPSLPLYYLPHPLPLSPSLPQPLSLSFSLPLSLLPFLLHPPSLSILSLSASQNPDQLLCCFIVFCFKKTQQTIQGWEDA